jgi:hypothetical protein
MSLMRSGAGVPDSIIKDINTVLYLVSVRFDSLHRQNVQQNDPASGSFSTVFSPPTYQSSTMPGCLWPASRGWNDGQSTYDDRVSLKGMKPIRGRFSVRSQIVQQVDPVSGSFSPILFRPTYHRSSAIPECHFRPAWKSVMSSGKR